MTGLLIGLGVVVALYGLLLLVVGETGAWAAGRRPPHGWSAKDARRKYRRAFYLRDVRWQP